MKKVIKFLKDEEGVTAIEYGLIAALIGVAVAGIAAIAGTQIKATFQSVVDKLTAAGTE